MRSTVLILIFFHLLGTSVAQLVGTFAGSRDSSGFQDGSADQATFNNPHGIAISQSGNVYVTDRFNHLIRKISPDGRVRTIAGQPGVIGDADGLGAEALFYEPWAICVDADENVFVADTRNNKIRKISPDGMVSTYAGTGNYGTTNGPANSSTFGFPTGVEIDTDGNLYVADHGTHIIRKVSTDGQVSTLAGIAYIPGDADGDPGIAKFNKPYGLSLDLNGNIIIADNWNHKIRSVTPDGIVSTIAGTGVIGGEDGAGNAASFNYPWDVTVDSAGIIYVADGLNSVIRKIIPEGIGEVSTLAGTTGVNGNMDGFGTNARFSGATGVAFSPLTREIFVADAYNNLVRKITDPAQGVFLRLAEERTAICPKDSLQIRAFPNVYDEFRFYLDGTLVATKVIPNFDTLEVSSGLHTIRVEASLDTFEVISEDLLVEIYPSVPATIDTVGPTTFFEGDSVILIASAGAAYTWSNEETSPTLTVRESGTFFVDIVDGNACSNRSTSVEVTVRRDPDPIFITATGDLAFCEGGELLLSSSELTANQWIKDNWPISDATENNYIVRESGIYRVQYTSPEGVIVISEPVEVLVWPALELEVLVDRTEVQPLEEVQFRILNEEVMALQWDFGDTDSGSDNFSSLLEPTHSYNEEGSYDLSVFGESDYGCLDTLFILDFMTVSWDVDPNQNTDDVFVATAFTPNDDGVNDYLFVRGTDVVDMNFKVFNAKGQVVFESTSKNNGWDGRYKNKQVPTGNYIFQLEYTNLLGIKRQLTGVTTVLK